MKIFCLGQVSYDITLLLDCYPKENSHVKTFKKIESGSGHASNVACMLADWQEKTYIFGAIGNDYYGEKIKNSFFLHNVNTKYLTVKTNAHTTTNHIIINEKNGLATSAIFQDKNLTSKIPNFLTKKPGVIYFDGEEYNLSLKLATQYLEAKKILRADSYKENIISLIPYMNYVITSDKFIKEYFKTTNQKYSLENIKKTFQSFEKTYKTNFIITLEKGTLIRINQEYKLIPKIKVHSVDETATNDIYDAAFIYFLTNNYPIEKTIKLASIAKAISETRYGARFKIPNKAEVIAHDQNC